MHPVIMRQLAADHIDDPRLDAGQRPCPALSLVAACGEARSGRGAPGR